MKAKYVGSAHRRHLVTGNVYQIVRKDDDFYHVINEIGKKSRCSIKYFKVVEVIMGKYIGTGETEERERYRKESGNELIWIDLIPGKVYEIIGLAYNDNFYSVIDESGSDYMYPACDFEIVG